MNYASNSYVRVQTHTVLARWDEFRTLYGVNSIMSVIADHFITFSLLDRFGEVHCT